MLLSCQIHSGATHRCAGSDFSQSRRILRVSPLCRQDQRRQPDDGRINGRINLTKNLLEFEDGTTRYIFGAAPGSYVGPVNLKLRLPASVSCEYCVLQWWWKTASNNNNCGKQEQYKNCADIAIASNGQTPPSTLPTTKASTTSISTTVSTVSTSNSVQVPITTNSSVFQFIFLNCFVLI